MDISLFQLVSEKDPESDTGVGYSGAAEVDVRPVFGFDEEQLGPAAETRGGHAVGLQPRGQLGRIRRDLGEMDCVDSGRGGVDGRLQGVAGVIADCDILHSDAVGASNGGCLGVSIGLP